MAAAQSGKKASTGAAACASSLLIAVPDAMSAGKVQRPQRQLLELLRALAEAGRHPAALPFVLRTLQPLLSAGGWCIICS